LETLPLDNLPTHLILGGAGFIGRHVAVQLASHGYNVVIADRVSLAFKLPSSLGRVQSILIDFATANWDELIRNVDVVHHYAWNSIPASANSNPLGDLSANLAVTLGLLEALRRRGHGRVVFSSSGGTVYGRTSVVPIPEDHRLAPITAYGAGKASAEMYLGLYRDLYGLDCRIARIANPYGAGQNINRGQGAVTTFLQKALAGQEIVIWGDGQVTRDYVHVTDVAQAMFVLATVPYISVEPIFNIGSGHGLSLNNILDEIEHRLARRLLVKRQEGRHFDIPVNVLDIAKAKTILSLKDSMSFRDGLDHTIADIVNHAHLSS
jgi:UDP-glucose 4-epimerase